ncbi:MAG TPA: MFS transporter [Actinomycetales bacterium]|nr:MFS transporter [Actinomycetales bacterium]
MSSPTSSLDGPLSPRYRVVTAGLLALVTLVAFEALAVSTAMPVVARELGGVRSYGLAFSLFLTMQLLGTVLAGGWSDRRGPQGPLICGLVLFVAGLLVCGLAMNFPVLLLGRVVSGAGGGFLGVALYVVVARAYPDALHPRVFGWISAAWVLPSVIGPPVAGWLADQVTWRAVFLGVPPFAVLALAVLLPRLAHLEGTPTEAPTLAAGERRRRVLFGLALASGATLVQWGAQEAATGRPAALFGLAAGVVLLVVSLPRLLPPGTLALRRGLPSVIAVRGLFTASFFAAETFVPLMLVQERGLRPLVAGLALTSGAVGWATGSWVQSRPRQPWSRSALLVAGALVVAVATAALPLAVLPQVPPYIVAPLWLVAGFGMGLAMTTTSVLALELSPASEQGRNSASLQISDSLGGVLGIGLAGAVFAALHQPSGDDGPVFVGIWLGLAVVAALAALVGRRTATVPVVPAEPALQLADGSAQAPSEADAACADAERAGVHRTA